jgi:histidine triad (HIT) family protein
MPKDPNCIFCKIVAREIPSTAVFENNELYVFPDIHPKAPVHLLIIPKDHILRSVAEMEESQTELLGRMLYRAKLLAEKLKIDTDGYRLVFNVRHHGGQEVDHIHLHLLGGQALGSLG